MLGNADPDSDLQTTVWNSIETVGERLEAQGEDLYEVIGLFKEVYAAILDVRGGFDRLKGSLKSNIKNLERKK